MSEASDLPPLWADPPPMGHNGGPPLQSRPPGRPTISTPEIRSHILDLMAEGIPLRAICRAEGMPGRQTVYRWRQDDPAFDAQCQAMQLAGYHDLMDQVRDEVERLIVRRGPEIARLVFNIRQQQLARMNPAFFGNRGIGR